MSKNYHEITRILKSGRSAKGKKSAIDGVNQSVGFSRLTTLLVLSFLLLIGAMGASAQTVLIDPTTNGGFENGSSGWTFVNDKSSQWAVGTAAKKTGNKSIYISNDGGESNAYSVVPFPYVNQCSYFYKDIDIPAGQSIIKLKFNWRSNGDNSNDLLQVYYTSVASQQPVAGQILSGVGVNQLGTSFRLNPNGYKEQISYLPASLAGTSIRLIFQWQNNVGGGAQPPASVDDISLTSVAPSTISSARSGLFSAPETWLGGRVPTEQDNFIVEKGHAVAIDAASLKIKDVTVKGVLKYDTAVSTNVSDISIAGDLKIENGGRFIMHNGQYGQTVNIAGNLINDGAIDNTINYGSGTGSLQGFVLNGTSPQTISGTGSFGAYLGYLKFNNTSSEVPNIYLNVNNLVVAGELNIASGKIQMPVGNKISLGSAETVAAGFPVVPTLTWTAGNGFLQGAKISRYFLKIGETGASPGAAIAAGADPLAGATSASGQFPFVTSKGVNRSLYLKRSNTANYTASQIMVQYTDVPSITSGLSIADNGSYTINKRLDSNWAVATDGITSSNIYEVVVMAGLGLYPLDNSSRLMYANEAFAPSATHQNASLTPCAQRIGLSENDLTGHGPLYVGITDSQSMIYSVKNGNWEDALTWSKGDVPTSTDKVVVSGGTTVNVTEPGNSCLGLTVAATGNLVFKQGVDADLTVGTATNKNSSVTVNGRLTMNSGANFNIYGSLLSNNGSEFIQNGGNITVDGNTGTAGTSVPTGTALISLNSNVLNGIQLKGGNLIIANPHIGLATGQDYALKINQAIIADSASPNHTVQFGDGLSTLKNDTNGFRIITANTRNYSLGAVIVNGVTTTGRFVTYTSGGIVSMTGNLEIFPGGELRTQGSGSVYIGGNLINNGTLTSTGNLGFTLYDGVLSPTSNLQTISGGGVFRNLTLNPTAKLTNLVINNTAGVTSNIDLTMSGKLTLTNGKLNVNGLSMTSTATIDATGGGSAISYVNGVVTRSIPANNPNSTYHHFPVGTVTGYAPIWLAPTSTTSVLSATARALDTNAGSGASLTRSWVAPISGTFTNLNVKIGGVSITAASLPVVAPTASGVYTETFGITSTFTSGIVSTVQSSSPSLAANYSGYVSYSDSAVLPADCVGKPTPGNTNSSSNILSLGDTVTLSLQNATPGEKVSYLWEQSTDGVNYTAMSWATSSTYTVKPLVSTWYKCNVTCGVSNTGVSEPLQITFVNSVSSTVAASRCGYGTVTLGATGNAGSTISWYDSVEGGKLLGKGNTLVTPAVGKTTNFYAAAETTSPGTFTVGPATFIGAALSFTTGQPQYFSSVNGVTLVSVDVFPFAATQTVFSIYGTGPDGGQGSVVFTKAITFTQAQVDAAKTNSPVPTRVDLNFPVPAGAKGYSLATNVSVYYSATAGAYIFPMTNSDFSITGPTPVGDGSNNDSSSSKFYYFNWRVESPKDVYSSPRIVVKATVNDSSPITLSSDSATICSGGVAQVSLTSPIANYDTYVWTPVTGVTGSAATGWIFNPTSSTTYTLVGTKGECQSSVTFDVTAGPKTAAVQKVCAQKFNGNNAFDVPTLFSLSPAPSTTVKWYQTNTIGEQELFTKAVKLVDGTTYYVSQLLSCGESSRVPVKVEFNVTAPPTGTSTQYFCGAGVKVNALTVTAQSGAVVTWYANNIRVTTTADLMAANYSATASIDGCESDRFNVLVRGRSVAPTGETAQTVCGAGRTLADLVVAGAEVTSPIKWYSAPTGGTPYASTQALSTATSYYAAQDNSLPANGSCLESSNRFKVTVTLNGSLTLTTVPASICEGATLTLPAAVGGVVGTWSPAAPVGGVTQTQTYTFNTATCGAASKTITMTAVPALPAVASAQTYCNAVLIKELSPAGNNVTIYWFDGPSTGASFKNINFSVPSGTQLYLGTANGACNSPARTPVLINVIVAPAPVALPQTFCNVTPTIAMLTATGADIEWYTTVNGVTPLLPTDVLTTRSYFAEQKVLGCKSLKKNVGVTINTTAAPEVVDNSYAFCNIAGAVSALSASGELVKWYDSVSTSPLASVIGLTSGNYYATQTWFECESQKSSPVSVIINVVSAPSGAATQTVNAGATIAALSVTGVDVVWYASAENALADVYPLTSTTELVNGTVYYAMQSVNGCRGTAPLAVTVTVTPALAVGQFDIAGLQFYPNPVVDYINISNTSDITSVRVFNMLGQGVMTVRPSVTTAKIDMSALPIGTYLMEVRSEGKTAKFKVVKK